MIARRDSSERSPIADRVRPSNVGWSVRQSESFEIDSTVVGDTFAIGVASSLDMIRDLGVELSHKTPLDVVYVLDGAFSLGVAASICQLQLVDLVKPGVPPLLLVGIDYPEGALNQRTRDYTMPGAVPAHRSALYEGASHAGPGGAEKFLKFIEQELDPFIRSVYNVSENPAGLLGHSYGATLGYYAFLNQSPLFNRYWLGSPGIFSTDNDYAGQLDAVLSNPLRQATKLFLSFGSLEAKGGAPDYEDMGRNYVRIVDSLTRISNESLSWQSKFYLGYTHVSVFAPSLNDALLYLYGEHGHLFEDIPR